MNESILFRKGVNMKAFKAFVFFMAIMAVLLCRTAFAQELDLKGLAVGGGSAFGEEEETFDTSALFGSVQWHGLKLPMNSSTGVCLEIGVKPSDEGENRLPFTLWSLNRTEIVGDFYAGTDLKILENSQTDFDLRIVTGTLLSTIGEGKLVLEVYSLEEDRPISFAVLYRF